MNARPESLRSACHKETFEPYRKWERNKRNGRSLFGLMESLKAQKKDYAASLVQREFEQAWKNAEARLTLKDLW